jgi:hypothetical protein
MARDDDRDTGYRGDYETWMRRSGRGDAYGESSREYDRSSWAGPVSGYDERGGSSYAGMGGRANREWMNREYGQRDQRYANFSEPRERGSRWPSWDEYDGYNRRRNLGAGSFPGHDDDRQARWDRDSWRRDSSRGYESDVDRYGSYGDRGGWERGDRSYGRGYGDSGFAGSRQYQGGGDSSHAWRDDRGYERRREYPYDERYVGGSTRSRAYAGVGSDRQDNDLPDNRWDERRPRYDEEDGYGGRRSSSWSGAEERRDAWRGSRYDDNEGQGYYRGEAASRASQYGSDRSRW